MDQSLVEACTVLFGPQARVAGQAFLGRLEAGEVKRAFRRLALRTHPDLAAGGSGRSDPRRFIEVLQAYELLAAFVEEKTSRPASPRAAPRHQRPAASPAHAPPPPPPGGRSGRGPAGGTQGGTRGAQAGKPGARKPGAQQGGAREPGAQARQSGAQKPDPREAGPREAGPRPRAQQAGARQPGAGQAGAQRADGPQRPADHQRPGGQKPGEHPRAGGQGPGTPGPGGPGPAPRKPGAQPGGRQPGAQPGGAQGPGTRKPGERQGGLYYHGPLPQRQLRLAEYLYYRGLISWQSLIEAIVWQRRGRPKFGELAQEARTINREELLHLMRSRQHAEQMGDTAVRLRLLTAEEVTAILRRQRARQKRIGGFFVESERLSHEELSRSVLQLLRHNARWRQKG